MITSGKFGDIPFICFENADKEGEALIAEIRSESSCMPVVWGLPPQPIREGPWRFFQELKDEDFEAWSDYYGE